MAQVSRRKFASLVALALMQVGIPKALAATGPTLKPTRLGQVIVWRGKKYTAIKSGKKIIWNKGVPLPAATPDKTSSATPTPSPTASPSASPSVLADGPYQVDIAASTDVKDGTTQIFYSFDPRSKGKSFVITREKGKLIAFDNNCTHEACAVEEENARLVCHCHESYFNRITGAAEEGPASEPLKKYDVIESGGRILVTDIYKA